MPRRSWKQVSTPLIAKFFNQTPPVPLKEIELRKIINRHRRNWRLPESLTNQKLLNFLTESSLLTRIEIKSAYEAHETIRYSWGEVSRFAIANSLRPSSYLAYSSAAYILGLVDEIPKTLYVNKEQSPKPPNSGSLHQANIDRAFSNKQRKSEMSFSWNGSQAIIINGKSSNRLGVITKTLPSGENIDITNLERTLLDMTVRPGYSGGVYKVLEAYQKARNELKPIRLHTYLRKLDYTYPYHQSIGFYLEKSGFPEKALSRFRQENTSLNFYLDYALSSKEYVDKWKLYVPQGFGLDS